MRLIGKRFLAGQLHRWRAHRARQRVLDRIRPAADDISRADWESSLHDPSAFYLRAFCYFHRRLPAPLQEHRRYFTRAGRGFGEDAFHTMWFLLHREFRFRNFLEIGVYRGQTISLAALLAHRADAPREVHGISPFSSAGDSVSRYRRRIDYLADTLRHFDRFKLPRPELLKALSTDAAARERIASRRWEAVYIDGNHDYEVARADWEVCAANMAPGGIIVLDDAALGTKYEPPPFAFGGHPGPSRVAGEIDRKRFREILQVGHNRVFQRLD